MNRLRTVAATVLVLLLAACGSSANANAGSSTLPKGTAKALGTTVSFPADKSGLVSVAVLSYKQPVPGDPSTFTTPPTGDVFGVIDVKVCAGPGGSPKGPQTTNFVGYTADKVSILVDLTNDATSPALDSINSLGPNKCGEGSVTFDVPKGERPASIAYSTVARWAVPPA